MERSLWKLKAVILIILYVNLWREQSDQDYVEFPSLTNNSDKGVNKQIEYKKSNKGLFLRAFQKLGRIPNHLHGGSLQVKNQGSQHPTTEVTCN